MFRSSCSPTAATAIWLRRTELSIGCAIFAPPTARAELRRGRTTEKITTAELPPEQTGPILRISLQSGPPGIPRPIVRIFRRFFVLPYLDVDLNSPVDDFVRSAVNHPVFRVQPVVQS
jgi:hypothetical protein